jgi:hypothetical protein
MLMVERRTPGVDVPEPDVDIGATDGRSPVCPVGFCPIGMALTLTDQVRPEVIEHLLAAGRELLLAVKAVIDSRAEGLQRSSPLEKIDIT